MKALFWLVLSAAVALGAAGVAVMSFDSSTDPGTRGAPTLFGVGLFLTTAGITLALTALGLAAWWLPIARAKARLLSEHPAHDVLIVQATASLRALDRGALSSRTVPTYLVCTVSAKGMEFWSSRQMVLRVPVSSIHGVSVGTATTSREVPSLVFTSALGVIEIVPGRSAWEMFPMFNRHDVALLGERLLSTMKV